MGLASLSPPAHAAQMRLCRAPCLCMERGQHTSYLTVPVGEEVLVRTFRGLYLSSLN